MTHNPLRDRAAIVGIGETTYTKAGQTTETEIELACQAIIRAVADAGLELTDVDGLCTYESDRNDLRRVAQTLGLGETRFLNLAPGGGPAAAAVVHNAALAVYGGAAQVIVCYRSVSQGQTGRFGSAFLGSGYPLGDDGRWEFFLPFGVLSATHWMALDARRHMHLYGTTSEQFAEISLASYGHAQRNPRAVMHGRPLTLEQHQASRLIADPYHLYDCCLESDGACALVVTSAVRAASLRHRPASIAAAAQVMAHRDGPDMHVRAGDRWAQGGFVGCATELFAQAGIVPSAIDVAQIYEDFTGQVLMALEDFGFCARGEGGPFAQSGCLRWPDGDLPLNTSGGHLAEGYIHGLNHVVEGVRQIRGDSTCQVPDVEHCLVAGSPSSLGSALILRRLA